MEAPPLLSQIENVHWRMSKLCFEDNDEHVSTDTYEKAKKNIRDTASTFIPKHSSYGSIDIMALSCTSMSFALGSSQVQKELSKGYPSAIIKTDMATAVVDALRYMCTNIEGNKIGLLTPYVNELHQKNINFLKNNGFNIVADHNLNLKTDSIISSVNPQSILECAKELINKADNIDVILIGCSALRSTGYGFIDYMEESLGVPVITSNQALMWHCLTWDRCCYAETEGLTKSSNISKQEIRGIKGYGKLFYEYK
jgi:maleate isomerase